MSGKHVKHAAWRPRRLAPVLTLLGGMGTWVALGAVLVLLPGTPPADVRGPLDGSGQVGPDAGSPPSAIRPHTLRVGPGSPTGPTPSAGRTTTGDDPTTAPGGPTSDPATGPGSGSGTGPTTGSGGTGTPQDPAPTSPPGNANGHDGDHPGHGHGNGPHGQP